MLSAADVDLVQRDAAIPGLATVLDPDALVAALRRAAPQADLRAARITQLKLKPGDYCRVTHRLDVGGSELDVDAHACRPEDLARWVRDRETGVPGPLGPGRIVLSECATVIMAFPNDLKLPQLRSITDAVARRPMLEELLPDRPDSSRGELRCLSYWPERRYAAELRAPDGSRALLKLYTERAYERGKRNATAFESRGPLRVARLLGHSDSRRLLAFEWLPGRMLAEHCTAPEIDREAVIGAGAALAALHAQPRDGLTCWTRRDEVAYVTSLAEEVAYLCPDLAWRAARLAQRLAARLAAAPAMHAPVHGDFHPKQVLTCEQQAAIVDFDWACCGDPADDLGNMCAQIEHYALRGRMSRARVEVAREALLEGYGSASGRPLPERIALYTALGLLRKSRFPFRARHPDWPQGMAAILGLAESVDTQ